MHINTPGNVRFNLPSMLLHPGTDKGSVELGSVAVVSNMSYDCHSAAPTHSPVLKTKTAVPKL